MMNKKLSICLAGSIVFHVLLFLNMSVSLPESKINFADKSGASRIKARFQIFERSKAKTSLSDKKVGNLKRKKSAKAARKQVSAVNSEEKTNTGSEELVVKYLSEVRSIIAKNKFKKRMARKLKMTGSVKLNFIIRAPNQIEDLKIIEPSKFKQLNDSAIQTINSVKRIPVIPATLNRVEIPVTLVISYE